MYKMARIFKFPTGEELLSQTDQDYKRFTELALKFKDDIPDIIEFVTLYNKYIARKTV